MGKTLDLTEYKSDLEARNKTLFTAEIVDVHSKKRSTDAGAEFSEALESATCVYDLFIKELQLTIKDIPYGGFSLNGWAFAPVLPQGTQVKIVVSRDKHGGVSDAAILNVISTPPIRTVRQEGLPNLHTGDIFINSSAGAMIHLKNDGNIVLRSNKITANGRKGVATIKLGNDTKTSNPSTGNPNIVSIELADRGVVFGVDNKGNVTFNAPEISEAFMRLIENVDAEKVENVGFAVTALDNRLQKNNHGTKKVSIGKEQYTQVGHTKIEKVGFHTQKLPFEKTELGITHGVEHNIKGDFGVWVGKHYDEYLQPSGGSGKIYIADKLAIDVLKATTWKAGDFVSIEKHFPIPYGGRDTDSSMQDILSMLIPGLSLTKEPVAKANILVSILKMMALMFDQHRHGYGKEQAMASPPPYTLFLYTPNPLIGGSFDKIPSNILKVT